MSSDANQAALRLQELLDFLLAELCTVQGLTGLELQQCLGSESALFLQVQVDLHAGPGRFLFPQVNDSDHDVGLFVVRQVLQELVCLLAAPGGGLEDAPAFEQVSDQGAVFRRLDNWSQQVFQGLRLPGICLQSRRQRQMLRPDPVAVINKTDHKRKGQLPAAVIFVFGQVEGYLADIAPGRRELAQKVTEVALGGIELLLQ